MSPVPRLDGRLQRQTIHVGLSPALPRRAFILAAKGGWHRNSHQHERERILRMIEEVDTMRCTALGSLISSDFSYVLGDLRPRWTNAPALGHGDSGRRTTMMRMGALWIKAGRDAGIERKGCH